MVNLLVALLMTLAPGSPAPVLDVTTIEGTRITSESLKGRVVMVDFWATWCGPCVKSLPIYQEMYERHKAKGLTIIAVSIDDELPNLKRFVKAHNLKLPIVHDADKTLVKFFAPPKMPTAYLIDRAGNIHEIHAGYEPGDEAKIEKKIKAMLEAP